MKINVSKIPTWYWIPFCSTYCLFYFVYPSVLEGTAFLISSSWLHACKSPWVKNPLNHSSRLVIEYFSFAHKSGGELASELRSTANTFWITLELIGHFIKETCDWIHGVKYYDMLSNERPHHFLGFHCVLFPTLSFLIHIPKLSYSNIGSHV